MSDRNLGWWRTLRERIGVAPAAVLAGAAAILIGVGAFNTVFGFVDEAWNGSFIDWVTPQFLNINNLDEMGLWPELVLDVSGIKFFFLELGICIIIVLVVAVIASVLIAARHTERTTRAEAARLVQTYMAHDLDAAEAFPAGWEELALVASDAKRASEDQARRLADEARRRSDLITYLAHDLKTPLTSVIGYLALLDEIPEMPREQRCRYVGITLDKARRLERLINEFFDITRYSLSHIELEVERVDLGFMLVQMVDEFYPQLAAHGNEVELTVRGQRVEPGGEAPELAIEADPGRLARVFNNVLKNAIAYSREGTPIEVAAEVVEPGASATPRVAPGSSAAAVADPSAKGAPASAPGAPACRIVRVTVADTGATIPPHRLEAIFDKFFRLDETRATATGGAGLGLAIAREIVELHGGTISAQSASGRTVFTIDLPA